MRIGNINGEGRSLFPTDNSLDVPATPAIGFAGDENTGIYQPTCLLYTSPSPRDRTRSRMPSSA